MIGGGITGCLAALESAKLGHDVEIYEMSASLGGIMQDIQHNATHYYNGCHYFDRGTQWYEDLRPMLDCEFSDFVHEYGSLTALQGDRHVHKDFAQPVFSGTTPTFENGPARFSTVGQRLDAYPVEIAQLLRKWSQGFGDPDTLQVDCVFPMQVGRVFFADDLPGMTERKAQNEVADQLLGLPRSVRAPHAPKETASLPVKGYDAFFEALTRLLVASGVKIHTRSAVAPLADGPGQLKFRTQGQALVADQYIWCSNPTALLIAAGVGRLDSPVTNMFCLAADVADDPRPGAIYYQIFSNTNRVVRIYSYDLEGAKITVEGFDFDQDDAAIKRDVEDILRQLDMPAVVGAPTIIRQKRYVNFTPHDLDLFERFERIAPGLKVVTGGWQHYSRDRKLVSVLEQVRERSAA